MVSDRVIGGAILIVSVAVIVIYLIGLLLVPLAPDAIQALKWINDREVQLWLIRIPIIVAVVGIGAIAAWIGWTILTTPPPKPIEEIQKELEEAAKQATQETSKEQPPAPPEKK